MCRRGERRWRDDEGSAHTPGADLDYPQSLSTKIPLVVARDLSPRALTHIRTHARRHARNKLVSSVKFGASLPKLLRSVASRQPREAMTSHFRSLSRAYIPEAYIPGIPQDVIATRRCARRCRPGVETCHNARTPRTMSRCYGDERRGPLVGESRYSAASFPCDAIGQLEVHY